MKHPDLSHVHEYLPGTNDLTLLLLHGTGGDERDLLPLGRTLAPEAGLLSPRGQVLEHGMPRFFRRLAEGVFDVEDVRGRAVELAAFVGEAAGVYGFDRDRVVAVGFSNGANIAAAILLLHPRVLAGAVLLHAMVPIIPEELPDLSGVPVLITGGRHDPIATPDETERLAELLRRCGASVEIAWLPGGHNLTLQEVENARRWLETEASKLPKGTRSS